MAKGLGLDEDRVVLALRGRARLQCKCLRDLCFSGQRPKLRVSTKFATFVPRIPEVS